MMFASVFSNYHWWVVLIGLCGIAQVLAEDVVDCTADFNTPIVTCLVSNYCTCDNCAELEPFNDEYFSDFTQKTCTEVHDLMCPWIRCCSPCVEEKQTYMQCGQVEAYMSFGLIEEGCVLDCSGYDITDIIGDDESCAGVISPTTAPGAPVSTEPPTPAPNATGVATWTPTESETTTSDICQGDFVTPWTTCIYSNYCTCDNCEDRQLDFNALFEDFTKTATCEEAHDTYCPYVRCCSDCWEAAQTYMQCTSVNIYADNFALIEDGCVLDCSGYEAKDEPLPTDDCQGPTGSFTPAPSPSTTQAPSVDDDDDCSSAFVEYTLCIAQNTCECSSCLFIEPDFFYDVSATGTTSCAATHDGYCPSVRCCEPCWEASQKWSQCSVVDLWVDSNILEDAECELDCTGYALPDFDPTSCDTGDDDVFGDYSGCTAAYTNYFTCILQNCIDDDTSDCSNYDDDSYWSDENIITCSDYSEALCSTSNNICCPECVGALGAFAECVTQCDIACADDVDGSGGGGTNNGGSGASEHGGMLVGLLALGAGTLAMVIW